MVDIVEGYRRWRWWSILRQTLDGQPALGLLPLLLSQGQGKGRISVKGLGLNVNN